MNIGIVGHEAEKFTAKGKRDAKDQIGFCLLAGQRITMVSGGCHLGGVDIWAEELADRFGHETKIFKPQRLTWESKGGQMGFKERNIKIAETSDILYCIAVARHADSYKGMKFSSCYHCKATDHVKGGGCWTMKYAKELGKETHLIIIPNEE